MLATAEFVGVAVGLGLRVGVGLAVGVGLVGVGLLVVLGAALGVVGLGVTRLDVSPDGPATSAHPTSPAAATTAPTIHRLTSRR
ncbi:hypothetical protein AB0H36_35815 [Kribbella sp. NPDC050820]|uniref:hypothetical protein n=1 Tax=Kribbella sp. NPDC050820 TaxID=3155408 RepID=UPI0033EF5D5F